MTILGLTPNTQYSVRVLVGRENDYDASASIALFVATYISRAFCINLCFKCARETDAICAAPSAPQVSESTSSSVTISWTASPEAIYYDVHYRVVQPSRAITDGFTFSDRVQASA